MLIAQAVACRIATTIKHRISWIILLPKIFFIGKCTSLFGLRSNERILVIIQVTGHLW